MSNLRAEQRPDVTGKIVTRHVRDTPKSSTATTAKLTSAKPTVAKTPNPYRQHFTEFDPSAAPRDGYEVPTTKVTQDGTTRTEVGSKYSGLRDVSEIKKSVESDLKEAVDAGYLPDGLKIRLRTSRAARVQSLAARIEGMPDSMIYTAGEKTNWGGPSPSPLAETIQSRVNSIVGAYDSSYSDWQSDGGGNVYYYSASIVDEEQKEWELQQAADKRRAREQRIEQGLS